MISTPCRLGPGQVKHEGDHSVTGFFCPCPACGHRNFVPVSGQEAQVTDEGLTLQPGFVCQCQRHISIRNSQFVVNP